MRFTVLGWSGRDCVGVYVRRGTVKRMLGGGQETIEIQNDIVHIRDRCYSLSGFCQHGTKHLRDVHLLAFNQHPVLDVTVGRTHRLACHWRLDEEDAM
jgi:hypothetical protein